MTEFDEAVKHNEALRSNLTKVQEDLNPIRVLGLFERISKEDCDLLDIHDRCAALLAQMPGFGGAAEFPARIVVLTDHALADRST